MNKPWIVLFVSCLLSSSILTAKSSHESVFFSYCSISSNPYSFENCVNSNFSTANREWNVYMGYCSGVDRNSFSFENCVNSNFQALDRALNVVLNYCSGSDNNPYGFENCINNNFNKLSNY